MLNASVSSLHWGAHGAPYDMIVRILRLTRSALLLTAGNLVLDGLQHAMQTAPGGVHTRSASALVGLAVLGVVSQCSVAIRRHRRHIDQIREWNRQVLAVGPLAKRLLA